MERCINVDNATDIIEFHCPRYSELPKVSLYKDQVIIYIEDVLKEINLNSQEKLLTPTMLNNYVKQKVVSPPKDKRYGEKHLAYLIVVCILKQVYSLNEVCELIKIQIATCPIEQAYDYFCVELEKALKSAFTTSDLVETNEGFIRSYEGEVVKAAATSFAHKIFIQKYLKDMGFNSK